jgi:hypothetical protein
MVKETKSVQVNLRLTPGLKAAMDKAAAADHRSITSLIEKVMIEYLKKAGFLRK